MVRSFILECFVNIVHVPPGKLYWFEMTQLIYKFNVTIDSYIAVFMLARLYICMRLFENYSRWTNRQSYRIW